MRRIFLACLSVSLISFFCLSSLQLSADESIPAESEATEFVSMEQLEFLDSFTAQNLQVTLKQSNELDFAAYFAQLSEDSNYKKTEIAKSHDDESYSPGLPEKVYFFSAGNELVIFSDNMNYFLRLQKIATQYELEINLTQASCVINKTDDLISDIDFDVNVLKPALWLASLRCLADELGNAIDSRDIDDEISTYGIDTDTVAVIFRAMRFVSVAEDSSETIGFHSKGEADFASYLERIKQLPASNRITQDVTAMIMSDDDSDASDEDFLDAESCPKNSSADFELHTYLDQDNQTIIAVFDFPGSPERTTAIEFVAKSDLVLDADSPAQFKALRFVSTRLFDQVPGLSGEAQTITLPVTSLAAFSKMLHVAFMLSFLV